MKFAVIAVSICLLFALLQPAAAIKCYACTASKENCKTNKVTCSNALFTFDYCFKTVGKDGSTAKGCSTKAICDGLKSICDKADCKYSECCQGDLCNASTNLKSMSVLVALTTLAAMAQVFLM